jgi:Xaa-Pro aminopeptidase
MDTRTSPIRQRITLLREAMAKANVQAVLVPSSDPHLSEYLPGHWQGREWLSGFTGSMATLIVTSDRAALFADSRYWVQAAAQLEGTPIELVKINTGTSTVHLDWLAQNMPRGSLVAVDGQVLGLAMAKALKAALDGAGVQLRTDIDVLNSI